MRRIIILSQMSVWYIALFTATIIDALTASVIVPCHFKHAQYLNTLVEAYAMQTEFPDEIVISIGSVDLVSKEIIDSLQSRQWPFLVKLILDQDSLLAGEHRNKACRDANGDILILQDADDVPHPQRVEVVKFIFQNYNVDHLIHGYGFSIDDLLPIDLHQLEWSIPEIFYPELGANGVVCIKKHVFDAIQWGTDFPGEDVKFNQKAYEIFSDRIALKDKLYIYLNSRSITKNQ